MNDDLQFFSEGEVEKIKKYRFSDKLKKIIAKCTNNKSQVTRIAHVLLRAGFTSFQQVRDANLYNLKDLFGIGEKSLLILVSVQKLLEVNCHAYE